MSTFVKFWYENGNKQREANYKEGKLDGVVIDYDKTGKEASRRSYFQGILKSEFKSR
jgi:antitoxin component YwqK of YwqJK toxin-antitoxin module